MHNHVGQGVPAGELMGFIVIVFANFVVLFTGAVGGDDAGDGDDKEKAEEEERERQEAIKEAEDRRKEKHRKMEEEREKMRQDIRDKVSRNCLKWDFNLV